MPSYSNQRRQTARVRPGRPAKLATFGCGQTLGPVRPPSLTCLRLASHQQGTGASSTTGHASQTSRRKAVEHQLTQNHNGRTATLRDVQPASADAAAALAAPAAAFPIVARGQADPLGQNNGPGGTGLRAGWLDLPVLRGLQTAAGGQRPDANLSGQSNTTPPGG